MTTEHRVNSRLATGSDEGRIAVVTGAAGFIGRHVAAELSAHGYTVLGIGRGSWEGGDPEKWGISQWVHADIAADSLATLLDSRRADCYIHCAGGAAVTASYAQPHLDFEKTTSSTSILLDHVRTVNPNARVVLTSSAAVYGEQGGGDLSEDAPRLPISPYGFHKWAAELVCESYSRFFGVSTSIVRLFSVYGAGLRKQLLWDALQKYRLGRNIFFGTGEEVRDCIYVRDAAALLCAAAVEPQSAYEIYNGGAEKASIRTVLTQLLGHLGGPPVMLQFSGEVHPGNPQRLTGDCRRTREVLGWSPKVGLQAGLGRYVEWYKRILEP
jgi:UDP-glucose 4-epimerase